jgi:type II secretory pathway pseudopilin PulG
MTTNRVLVVVVLIAGVFAFVLKDQRDRRRPAEIEKTNRQLRALAAAQAGLRADLVAPDVRWETVDEVMTPRGALRVGDTMDDSLDRLKSGTRTSFELAADRFVGVYAFPSGVYRITFDRGTGQFRIQRNERLKEQ